MRAPRCSNARVRSRSINVGRPLLRSGGQSRHPERHAAETSAPHNKPLNLTGRLPRFERSPPRILRVLSYEESAARGIWRKLCVPRPTLAREPRRLWAGPLYGIPVTHALIETLLREADARSIDEARLSLLVEEYASETGRVLLDDLADALARQYVAGDLDYSTANGAMNWLMPVAGFESAPERFWEVYEGLERGETEDPPGANSRPMILAMVRAWDAA